MKRSMLLVSLAALVLGVLLFAYAHGTQPEQVRNEPVQRPAQGNVVIPPQPNPPAAEPHVSVKPIPWADESFLVNTDGGLAVYNMANGSLRYGLPPGLLSADGKRYVALFGEMLTQFDAATGRALEDFHVDIATGRWQLSSVESSGRWAALVRIAEGPEKAAWTKANTWHTDIQVIDFAATNNGKPVQVLHLDGNFDVDAIAPSGGSLFLIEHVPALKPEHYLIRLYDLWRNRLQDGALRDKLAEDDLMTGLAWSSLGTPNGQFLLTLYLDTKRNVAFVHTLDLQNQYPVCIDLPSGSGDMKLLKQYTLALAPDRRTVYAANAALGVVAEISLLTRNVVRTTQFTSDTFGAKPDDNMSAPTGRSIVSADGKKLFFTGGWDVWTYETGGSRNVEGPILVNAPLTSLAVSGDGTRLYAATAKDPVLVYDAASGAPLALPGAATSMSGR